jgi:Na+/melibiose symporter-like transporter
VGAEGWKVRFGVLRNVSFALLWTAGIVSAVGDWALTIGLAYFVYALTHSTLATGTLFLAAVLPQLAVGWAAGVFVDRWSRKRTMVAVNLLLAVGLLPLLLVHSPGQLWIVYAVAVFEACIVPFLSPAEGALIPAIVGEEDLLQANSIYGAGGQLARLIGAAAGGILVGLFGLAAITFVDAASFVVAAALVLGVREPGRKGVATLARAGGAVRSALVRFKQDWVDGLAVVARSRPALTMLLFVGITGFGEGVFTTLVAPFAVSILHGSGVDFGWFNALQAVGGISGGIFVAARAHRWDPAKVLPVASVLFGTLDLVLFTYPLVVPGIGLAFVLITVVGLPASAVGASSTSLQQSAVGESHRGRYLALVQTSVLMTAAAGAVVAGVLGGPAGIIPILEIQGLVYVVAGALVAAARLSRPRTNLPGPVVPGSDVPGSLTQTLPVASLSSDR